ncbi:MAG: shikimate dehydrogenase [Deltaproteobacteria bacterium]|nr:shikimate dehydrogenase [Deltaproteobacteria bacterium]
MGPISISSETSIYGLIGRPLRRSLSPRIHNTVFRRAGLNAVYLPFTVLGARLAEAAAGIRALGISGINVTIPWKEAILPHIDEISPAAAAIGAVNTISNRDGRLAGDNTDWQGFADSLASHGCDPAGGRAAVLGAGGAARAVLYALGKKNCQEIVIFNRTTEKAAALADHFAGQWPATAFTARPLSDFFAGRQGAAGFRLVVDTLPAAAGPELFREWPAAGGSREAGTIFYTINYRVAALEKAVPPGWRFIDGLEMLVRQAAASYLAWNPGLSDADGIRGQYLRLLPELRAP